MSGLVVYSQMQKGPHPLTPRSRVIYYGGVDAKLEAMIRGFIKENGGGLQDTGYTFERIPEPAVVQRGSREEALVAACSTGAISECKADLFLIDLAYLRRFRPQWLVEVDQIAAQHSQDLVAATCSLGGGGGQDRRFYAVPHALRGLVLYYNKQVIREKVPSTWDELLDAATELSKSDKMKYPIAGPESVESLLLPLLRSYNGGYWSNGVFTLTEPALLDGNVAAAKMLSQLAKVSAQLQRHSDTVAGSPQEPPPYRLFLRRQSAFLFDWSDRFTDMLGALPPARAARPSSTSQQSDDLIGPNDIGIARLPTATRSAFYTPRTLGWIVPARSSADPDRLSAIKTFLGVVSGEKCQTHQYNTLGLLPSHAAPLRRLASSTRPVVGEAVQAITNSLPVHRPSVAMVSRIIQDAFAACISPPNAAQPQDADIAQRLRAASGELAAYTQPQPATGASSVSK
jgi:ABC-type glycerol-3-phosphate transport system substrate-binding protein